MPIEEDSITILAEEVGLRLDKILAERYHEKNSRTYFQHLIEQHHILVNGKGVKKQTRPQEGDVVDITFVAPPEIDLSPEAIPLDILYEDQEIIAINKPAGMVVHPAPGNWKGTFVNALLYHCKLLSWEENRPGIVHRLDKDTSGVLLAAKSLQAQQKLIEQFASRQVKKEYLAICFGNPGNGQIEGSISRHPHDRKKMTIVQEGGKMALSRFETVKSHGMFSLVKIYPETGRTHQIRVHLKHKGTPVLGDSVYGNASVNEKHGVRQMLHASSLEFIHPVTQESVRIISPLPEDFRRVADLLTL